MWGNTAIKGWDQIFDVPTGELAVTYSDVQGGWSGSGNINSDPLFVNASGGDFRLQSSTPCDNIGNGTMPDDAGDLDWDGVTSEPVMLDLAGGARVNVTLDMGAYEIQANGAMD